MRYVKRNPAGSTRQASLIVEHIAMLDSGRSRSQQAVPPQQAGTTLGDGAHVAKPSCRTANPAFSFEPFAQCGRDRSGLGVAGQPREFAGKPASFVVLDVEAHGSHLVDDRAYVYPKRWPVKAQSSTKSRFTECRCWLAAASTKPASPCFTLLWKVCFQHGSYRSGNQTWPDIQRQRLCAAE